MSFASELTLILEFIDCARDGFVIIADSAVPLELIFRDVLPVNFSNDEDNVESALLISPIAEIDVLRSSIF